MAIYFFFFIWILLHAIFPNLQNKKISRDALFVCLGLFLCTGYMVGSDWRNYEYYYGRTNEDEHLIVETGYYLVTQLFSWLGVSFWHFYILTKIFCYVTIIKFIRKYTKGNYAWALLFFYSYLSLYYFIDCPFRNLIAASIFLYAIDAVFEKKWIRFVVVSLIAASFHISVLFFIPFFFASHNKRECHSEKNFCFLEFRYLFSLCLPNSNRSITKHTDNFRDGFG